MKTSTEQNYINRIDRVIEFLSTHVDNSRSLEKLAAVAAISQFHFQRVYRAVTGESPSKTLRRLRMAKASILLQESKLTITEIAFEVGYDSSQAFAKAFRDTTGTTASKLRAQPDKLADIITSLSNPPERKNNSKQILDVKVVSIEPFKVIAYRNVGSQDGLFRSFGYLYSWGEKKGLAESMQGIYGIPIDDSRNETTNDNRFDCCFNFGKDAAADDGLREEILGGGLFAVVHHIGPYDGLNDKYDYLYGTWLNTSDYVLRKQPIYNHYLSDPDTLPPEKWETDIYLPIDSHK